jgi:hypothetical protein
MRGIKSGLDAVKKANPNFVEIAARALARATRAVADPIPRAMDAGGARARAERWTARHAAHRHAARAEHVRLRAVLQRLLREPRRAGEQPRVLRLHERRAVSRGAGRGAIDPCFPAKIGIAHVHNLLYAKHAKKPLDYIFFPMVDVLHTPLTHLQGRTRARR